MNLTLDMLAKVQWVMMGQGQLMLDRLERIEAYLIQRITRGDDEQAYHRRTDNRSPVVRTEDSQPTE